jgi:hypothetical protein
MKRKAPADDDAESTAPEQSALEVHAALQGALKASPQLLRAADRLIDVLVYELYGLTEEEIAVVERGG